MNRPTAALFACLAVLAACGSSESGAPTGGASGAAGSAQGGSSTVSGTGGSSNSGNGGSTGTGGLGGNTTTGNPVGAPDIPGDLKLVALTPTQKAALCDWFVGLTGGYGVENACSAVTTVKNYDDQSQCVNGGLNFDCRLITISQFETCSLAQVPSHGCEYPDADCHWLFCR